MLKRLWYKIVDLACLNVDSNEFAFKKVYIELENMINLYVFALRLLIEASNDGSKRTNNVKMEKKTTNTILVG